MLYNNFNDPGLTSEELLEYLSEPEPGYGDLEPVDRRVKSSEEQGEYKPESEPNYRGLRASG